MTPKEGGQLAWRRWQINPISAMHLLRGRSESLTTPTCAQLEPWVFLYCLCLGVFYTRRGRREEAIASCAHSSSRAERTNARAIEQITARERPVRAFSPADPTQEEQKNELVCAQAAFALTKSFRAFAEESDRLASAAESDLTRIGTFRMR